MFLMITLLIAVSHRMLEALSCEKILAMAGNCIMQRVSLKRATSSLLKNTAPVLLCLMTLAPDQHA